MLHIPIRYAYIQYFTRDMKQFLKDVTGREIEDLNNVSLGFKLTHFKCSGSKYTTAVKVNIDKVSLNKSDVPVLLDLPPLCLYLKTNSVISKYVTVFDTAFRYHTDNALLQTIALKLGWSFVRQNMFLTDSDSDLEEAVVSSSTIIIDYPNIDLSDIMKTIQDGGSREVYISIDFIEDTYER